MPKRMIIDFDVDVTRSRSFAAPVVTSWKTISSAARPPSVMAIWCMSAVRVVRYRSSVGSEIVSPSACPRETMVILCTGSVCSRKWPTIAWPISWYAVIFRSCSERRRAFFSGPAITRMIPSSSSSCSMIFLPRRAASRAASLTRLARSAPVKPGVPAASVSRSISGASGLPFVCTSRVLRRPVRSGRSTHVWRAEQRRVEDVGPVRGGDEDDVVLHLEAVHLDEQLVQGLLALVVTAAQAGAAVAADGVDLVHEHDARRRLLGLLEQVAHAGGADADEHLDEVGAGDGEEGNTRLAGDRAREQRLTGAGRAVEQNALGDSRAEG